MRGIANSGILPRPYALGIAVALLAALLVAGTVLDERAAATHQPANKMSVSGSAVEIMTAPLLKGSGSQVETLLTGTIRTSGPTDLILRVTSECALWTDLTTIGNSISEAVATVKMWVEIDGEPVPVSDDDIGEDAGKVVFCNRAFRMETSNFDDENATIKTFLRTRNANAFNWMTLNVGAGIHEVVLKGQLEVQADGAGSAKAAVGKRTLIVEPEKLSSHASV